MSGKHNSVMPRSVSILARTGFTSSASMGVGQSRSSTDARRMGHAVGLSRWGNEFSTLATSASRPWTLARPTSQSGNALAEREAAAESFIVKATALQAKHEAVAERLRALG